MKKFFDKITDPDFLVEHWKIITVGIGTGLLLCLLLIFIMQSNSNLKQPVRERSPQLEKVIEKNKVEQKELEETQQNMLDQNLKSEFTFGELTYKAPNIENKNEAFLNSTDQIIGSYKENVLFMTVNEGLYFYNMKDGRKEYITDLSVYHTLSSDGNLYYVEIEDGLGNRLMKYHIETKEKTEVNNLSFKQNISGVGGNKDIVYYIINEDGKSHIQAVASDQIGKNIRNMNIQVAPNSYLVQENENIYIINKSGQYIVKDASLNKVSDIPQVDFIDVKVWNGKPLLYGFNNKSQQSELHYDGKILSNSDSIFESSPINEKYLLINENNELSILDKNTLEKKEISKAATNSIVVDGNILFSLDKEVESEVEKENKSYFYYFEKQ